jgi:hypothetical protein
MPSDRVTPRERVESNTSSSARDSNLRASVSDREMQDYFREKRDSKRTSALEEFGVFDLVDAGLRPSNRTERQSTPLNSASDFRQRAQEVFTRIDQDANGYLSRQELSSAVQNRNLRDQDAQVVAGLYRSSERLINFSNDEWFAESEISMRDLDGLDGHNARAEQVRAATPLAIWSQNGGNFTSVDADGNGFISDSEITGSLNNPAVSRLERLALEHMRDTYDSLQRSSNDEWFFENDGITRNDLTVFARNLDTTRLDTAAVDRALAAARRTHESDVNQQSADLFAGANPEDAISPDAIRQGSIGDCYFLAALASVAHSNPERIQNMIRDNRNGTFTVTFPGAPQYPVTVSAPSEAEMGLYNGGSKFGTWAGVMERAYGQWRIESAQRAGATQERPITPAEGADGGGSGNWAMQLLTGVETTSYNTSQLSAEQIVNHLDNAFNRSERPRSAVAASLPGRSDVQLTPDGFARYHIYSIIGFERTGDNGGVVIIRNPWGGADNTTRGTMRVPLQTFQRNFGNFGISNS